MIMHGFIGTEQYELTHGTNEYHRHNINRQTTTFNKMVTKIKTIFNAFLLLFCFRTKNTHAFWCMELERSVRWIHLVVLFSSGKPTLSESCHFDMQISILIELEIKIDEKAEIAHWTKIKCSLTTPTLHFKTTRFVWNDLRILKHKTHSVFYAHTDWIHIVTCTTKCANRMNRHFYWMAPTQHRLFTQNFTLFFVFCSQKTRNQCKSICLLMQLSNTAYGICNIVHL